MKAFPEGKYDIVLCDPPWSYYGSSTKDAAAGKHYPLIKQEALGSFPIRWLMNDKAALFLWATCPRLDYAIDMIAKWGLHYRGVTYVWVKTNGAGKIINGQGVPPTFTKPTTELLLAATTKPRGRMFPILDMAQAQVVLHPRGEHSEKPAMFRTMLTSLCGDRSRIELFARQRVPGWDAWGNEVAV